MIYEFKPKQDLNGYSKPWPAGGGKNKLNVRHDGTKTTNNGVTATFNSDGTITLKGTATGQANITLYVDEDFVEAGSYILSISATAIPGVKLIWGSTGTSGMSYAECVTSSNVSATDDGTIGYHIIRVAQGTTVNAKLYPMLRLSSVSDATFEPYENVCPIIGYEVEGLDDPVYGGLLDSNSGVMLSGFDIVDLGDLEWSLSDGIFVTDAAVTGIKVPESADAALDGVLCTEYPNVAYSDLSDHDFSLAIHTTGAVAITNSLFDDADDLAAALSGVMMVFPLEEGEAITLTQNQINEFISLIGAARNFGSRTNMLNTWMKLAQGYAVPEEELHMLRPSMTLPDDVVLRPTFEDIPLPVPEPVSDLIPDVVDTPAAEPEENITESEES